MLQFSYGHTHNVYIVVQSLTPRNSIDAHFSHQYLKPQINIKNQVYTFAKHTPTINHHRLLVTIRCICFISGIFCANGKVGQMSYWLTWNAPLSPLDYLISTRQHTIAWLHNYQSNLIIRWSDYQLLHNPLCTKFISCFNFLIIKFVSYRIPSSP